MSNAQTGDFGGQETSFPALQTLGEALESLARADANKERVSPALPGQNLSDPSGILVPVVVPREREAEAETAAASPRRRIGVRGIEEEDGRTPSLSEGRDRPHRGMEDRELDVAAPESGLAKDAADDRVIEDRQHEVLHLDSQNRRRLVGGDGGVEVLLSVKLVEVEAPRVAPLVSLGALNGSHERV